MNFALLSQVKERYYTATEKVKGGYLTATEKVKDGYLTASNKVKNGYYAAVDTVKAIIEAIVTPIKKTYNAAATKVKEYRESSAATVQKIKEKASTLTEKIRKTKEGIKGPGDVVRLLRPEKDIKKSKTLFDAGSYAEKGLPVQTGDSTQVWSPLPGIYSISNLDESLHARVDFDEGTQSFVVDDDDEGDETRWLITPQDGKFRIGNSEHKGYVCPSQSPKAPKTSLDGACKCRRPKLWEFRMTNKENVYSIRTGEKGELAWALAEAEAETPITLEKYREDPKFEWRVEWIKPIEPTQV